MAQLISCRGQGSQTLTSVASIRLNADGVSDLHAQITIQDGLVLVENLDRETGTFVDGGRIEGPMVITQGQLQHPNIVPVHALGLD